MFGLAAKLPLKHIGAVLLGSVSIIYLFFTETLFYDFLKYTFFKKCLRITDLMYIYYIVDILICVFINEEMIGNYVTYVRIPTKFINISPKKKST